MNSIQGPSNLHFSRRTFLQAAGGTAAGLSLSSPHWLGSLALAQPAEATRRCPRPRRCWFTLASW
jgi:hypothetical protein